MTAEEIVVHVVAGVGGVGVLRFVAAPRRRFELLLIGAVAVFACVAFWTPPLRLIALPLSIFALPAAVVDLAEHRIPNRVSAMLFASEATGIAGAVLLTGAPDMLLRAVVGGAVWGGLLLASFAISGQPGPGDVKLAPSLGMLAGSAGWPAIGSAIAGCYLLAGFGALVLVFFGRRRSRIPLAPAMVGGTVLAVTMTSLAT